jgi:hypothetical protein
MAQKIRVGGSGYTIFRWEGTIIAVAESVQVNSVRPVTPAVAVQPLNALRPIEIAVPAAHSNGELIITMKELWGQSVWQRLAGLAGSDNIIQIMNTMAARENPVQIMKVMRHPNGDTWSETFFGCQVVDFDDSETITIDTMVLDKSLTVWYTHSDKSWITAGPGPELAPNV